MSCAEFRNQKHWSDQTPILPTLHLPSHCSWMQYPSVWGVVLGQEKRACSIKILQMANLLQIDIIKHDTVSVISLWQYENSRNCTSPCQSFTQICSCQSLKFYICHINFTFPTKILLMAPSHIDAARQIAVPQWRGQIIALAIVSHLLNYRYSPLRLCYLPTRC